jgi:integrase
MRQGELLGLKWADLDFQAELPHVRRSLAQVPGRGPVEQEPKTKASRRSLHLIPEALDALKRQRVRVAELKLRAGPEWEEHDYVFPNTRGGALNQSNLLHRGFYPTLVRAGLPRVRFHDLRHSVATYLFAMKKHPKAVQEALGHSEIRTTLDIYTHPASEAQVDALSALQRLFT